MMADYQKAWRAAEDQLRAANIRADRVSRALLLILDQTGRTCESFTSGIGSCFTDGRTADAQWGAERACPACVANAALNDEAIPLGRFPFGRESH